MTLAVDVSMRLRNRPFRNSSAPTSGLPPLVSSKISASLYDHQVGLSRLTSPFSIASAPKAKSHGPLPATAHGALNRPGVPVKVFINSKPTDPPTPSSTAQPLQRQPLPSATAGPSKHIIPQPVPPAHQTANHKRLPPHHCSKPAQDVDVPGVQHTLPNLSLQRPAFPHNQTRQPIDLMTPNENREAPKSKPKTIAKWTWRCRLRDFNDDDTLSDSDTTIDAILAMVEREGKQQAGCVLKGVANPMRSSHNLEACESASRHGAVCKITFLKSQTETAQYKLVFEDDQCSNDFMSKLYILNTTREIADFADGHHEVVAQMLQSPIQVDSTWELDGAAQNIEITEDAWKRFLDIMAPQVGLEPQKINDKIENVLKLVFLHHLRKQLEKNGRETGDITKSEPEPERKPKLEKKHESQPEKESEQMPRARVQYTQRQLESQREQGKKPPDESWIFTKGVKTAQPKIKPESKPVSELPETVVASKLGAAASESNIFFAQDESPTKTEADVGVAKNGSFAPVSENQLGARADSKVPRPANLDPEIELPDLSKLTLDDKTPATATDADKTCIVPGSLNVETRPFKKSETSTLQLSHITSAGHDQGGSVANVGMVVQPSSFRSFHPTRQPVLVKRTVTTEEYVWEPQSQIPYAGRHEDRAVPVTHLSPEAPAFDPRESNCTSFATAPKVLGQTSAVPSSANRSREIKGLSNSRYADSSESLSHAGKFTGQYKSCNQ